jgi:hypothetical protein
LGQEADGGGGDDEVADHKDDSNTIEAITF